MHRPLHSFAFALLVFVGIGLAAPTSLFGAKPYEETEKHHTWFSFSRPAEKSPAAQLARADRFWSEGKWKAASRAYRALVVTWPGSREAPQAQYRYAQSLEKRGKLDDAFDEYQQLMERYTGTFPYDEVLARQFDLATAMLNRRHGKFLMFGGWKAPERAIPMFEKVVQNGPRWEHAAEAQYNIGRAYELSDQQDLAVAAYLVVVQRYPNSAWAEPASFARARCWYVLSEDSPNDEESLEQAWTAVSTYLAAHPTSDNAELAREMKNTLFGRRARAYYDRALYYDRVAKRPKAALQSYRNFVKLFPKSEWTSIAQMRIEALSKIVEKTNEP